jgi:hypothetical protein
LPACAISSGVPELIQIRLNIDLARGRKAGSGKAFPPAGAGGQKLPGSGNSCRGGGNSFRAGADRKYEREAGNEKGAAPRGTAPVFQSLWAMA